MGFSLVFVVHALLLEVYTVAALFPLSPRPSEVPASSKNSSEDIQNLVQSQSNNSLCNLDDEAIVKRFSLHLEPLKWFDAMVVCWEEGGQLAVPRSPQEAKALGALLFKTRTPAGEVLGEALHVGIQDIAETGNWRTLDGFLLSAAGYDLWMEGGYGKCGALFSDGRYLKQPCHTLMRFACEKPNSLALRQASDYVEVGDAGRFRLYEEPLPWALAQRHCEEEGASLALPSSARAAGLLAGVFFTRASSNPHLQRNGFFVGITDVAKEGDWRTVRGDTLATAGYESWAQSHPSGSRRENCGALQRDGRYANYPCMSPMAYACQENTAPRNPEEEVVVRGKYRLHKKPLPWFEALQACQRENTTLVVVKSNEKSNVKELMRGIKREMINYNHHYYRNEEPFETTMIHVSIYNSNSTWETIYSEEKPLQNSRRHLEFNINEGSLQSSYESENGFGERPEHEEVINVSSEYGRNDCVGMKYNGLYYMVPCSRELPYLCKRKG